MIIRPATTEEIDFEVAVEEGIVSVSAGTPVEMTEDDATFDRYTGSSVDNYFDVFVDISTATIKQVDQLRITVGANGSVVGNRVSRVSNGPDHIKVSMPWLAKSVPVTFAQTGGQIIDELTSFANGSLAKSCSDGIDLAIANGGDLTAFTVANGTTFTRNPSFWLSHIDFTGVSPWNSESGYYKAGTAITSRHIIYAKHWLIAVGSTIYFVASDGQIITRTLESAVSLPGDWSSIDTAIGKLSSDLPPSITPFRLFPQPLRDYLPTLRFGVPVVFFTQSERVVVLDWQYEPASDLPPATKAGLVTPSKSSRLPYSQPIIPGDSGDPVFMIANGEAILVSHISGTGGGPSYYSFLDQIQSAIDTLGGGHSIQTVDLSSFTDFS